MPKTINASKKGALISGLSCLLIRGREHYREMARKSWDKKGKALKVRLEQVRENQKKAVAANTASHKRRKQKHLLDELIEFVQASDNPKATTREFFRGLTGKR